MSATVAKPSHPVFIARDAQLWLGDDPQGFEPIALNATSLLRKGGKIVECDQAPGPQPASIRLCITVENNDSHEVYTALILDVQRVLENRAINFRLFKRVLSSATPISKISAIKDGVFVSAKDGALYYGDALGPSPRVHTLLGAAPESLAASPSGPMADIVAAKDGIAEFLSNLLDALPKIVAAVEKRVGQEVLDAFAAAIKAQQQELVKVFNQPLSALIQQTPQASPNSALAAVSPSPGEPAEHAVRRLFVNKLELGRILSPFSEQPTLSTDIPAAAAAAEAVAATDPIDALGRLFEPLSSMLNAKNTQSLLNLGVTDLLEAISGSKPISDVLNDVFNIFKIDDTMNTFHSILSGGQCSALIGQVPLKDYLSKPVENQFFNALYAHYFPGKQFTALDFAAFMGALFGYVAFAAQGKTSTFNSVFSDPRSLKELTSCPEKLVQAISGSSPVPAAMPVSAAASIPTEAASGGAKIQRVALTTSPPTAAAPAEDSPPAELVAAACLVSTFVTLAIGVAGVFSFGTGLIASPITGGVAAGVGQCLGGILQNLDTRDAKWDLLGGFAGGFTGAFLSTLIGNKLFGIWAQKGDTPSARIQKLKLIMIGFTLTLGGGGGAVVSALLKNYAKSGKLVFDDPLALTTGAVGGIGGGAMGCGLHFMGALSGSSCLPVELSLAEANTIAMRAIAPPAPFPPQTVDRIQPLPAPNAAFPPGLLAVPNAAMGVYRIAYNDPGRVPTSGRSIAFVTYNEFATMDGSPPGATKYINRRQKLFWLEAGATPATPPPANRIADLVIGVHGIGRYVFPCITHRANPPGPRENFTRPMYKDDFVGYLAADPWITGFLGGLGRPGIIKLAVCFSALPLGCCSLSQQLATRLNAIVYGGRPPVYPWLDSTSSPRVPGYGGWVKYTP
jgi:hypothetical protein